MNKNLPYGLEPYIPSSPPPTPPVITNRIVKSQQGCRTQTEYLTKLVYKTDGRTKIV